MVRHGVAPFLECSSRGEKRLSAFYARPARYNGWSIEDIYQANKRFEDGSTGLTWRQAKGRKAVNQTEVSVLYAQLWNEYVREHPELLQLIRAASGLSDMFGQDGRCCQATELWRIRNG